jgi:quercetin dioxygenase-like cupin family protein
MPTFRWSALEAEAIDPQHSSATGSVFRGKKIEAGLVRHPAASAVEPHASPHEQVQSIVKGKARYRVGGEERVLGAGDAVLIRSNTEHSVRFLEDTEVVRFQDVEPAAGGNQEGATGPASSPGTR